MERVAAAIMRGECVLALSGAMLSNADVMLGLKNRAALPSVALSGYAVSPVRGIDSDSLLRAGGPKGVVVLVEPSMLDGAGITAIGKVLKGYTNKPTVFVVDRNFNPLMFAASMSGIKIEHIKSRGKAFMKQLPMPPTDAALPEVAAVRPAKKKDRGLSAIFVGREDEVAAMNEALSTGGPVVLVGPHGIGKRALVDNVLAESELVRLPDLTLGWDSGADTLWGRLALATQAGGSDALMTAITEKSSPTARITATIEALTAAEGCADKVLVIHDAQHIFGKEGDFFRKSRVELLVRALLTKSYALRIIFVSTVAPVLHRASDKGAMRVLTLEGLKGRFFHEIFEAYNAPEVERSLFGPLTERLYGNPLAVVAAAIAVRNAEEPAKLMEGKKFMNLASPDNLKLAQNVFKKRLDKLEKREQAAVIRICHLRQPVVAAVLVELGVEKKLRHKLLLEGLIQMSGKPGERTYGAHRVVQMIFSRRDVTQHDVMGHIAHVCRVDGERAEGVQKLALLTESIRYNVGARRFRELPELEVVNNDAVTESLKGLLRSDQPRFDLAAERITALLEIDAANSDVHLLNLEMLDRQNAKPAIWEAAAADAMTKAPVPEIFHGVVNHYLRLRKSRKAAAVLEIGIAALPDEPRLMTRLGSLLLQEGRRPDAIKMFRAAMDLAPQLPDAYGLLGMARRDEGVDVIAECEELLREAVRLAPNDIVQTSRLVDLLLARARVELKVREALLTESNDLLDPLVKGDNKASRAQVLLAEVIRESGGDAERARWLLKTAGKKVHRGSPLKGRIRLQNSLLDIAEGKLDQAETTIRALAEKDPTNHRIFMALSTMLEARGQVIPAHAEMLRARDRSGANSLDRIAYQREIERIQALIESGVTNIDYGLDDILGDASIPVAAPTAPRENVVRRRPGKKAKAAAAEE